MTWKRALASLAAGLAGCVAVPAAADADLAPPAEDAFFPDTVPVQLEEGGADTRVGTLIFRGGVAIAPDKADIGGVSGLEWHDGALYAVADDGRWMELTLGEVAGKLVDVTGIRLGPLKDPKGAGLGPKSRGDAEALTRLASGEWLVAFEQEHRIWRYRDLAGPATGVETRAAALVAGAEPNAGIETLAAWPGGVLACGEWAATPDRPNCLRITDGAAVAFALAVPEGIAEAGGVPTDAACRADGTCYVLFRSYTPGAGPGAGNRAAIVALAPDNTATTLAVLAPPLALDNFEGLAVREAQGRKLLYLVSDDNFRNCAAASKTGCQRTLLYKFELVPPPGAPTPPPPAPASFAAQPTGRPAIRPHPEAASVTVVLQTNLGPVTIAVETQRAPVTAANFLRYVDEKRFDGAAFYRTMDLPGERQPSGLVQGGARGEPKRVRAPIAHEPTSTTGLTHTHGAVSMAMNAPGEATGDFFVMVEDQTGFDADPKAGDPVWQAGYAVFGYVTGGMDIVAAMLASPRDPNAGEGPLKGQMLKAPVTIITARRAP